MQLEFKKYKEIDDDYIHSDLHLHSLWTDGKNSVEEIITRAIHIGLNRIAITDHIRKESTYFSAYYSEIKRLRNEYNFRTHIGFEAKVSNFNGEFDVDEKVLNKAELSIVSVHRFPFGRKLIPANRFTSDVSQEIELELSIATIKRGGFLVLGHPGGMSIKAHNIFKHEYFEEIISECAKNDIAFDFNSLYHVKYKKGLKKLFNKYNPLISIGSDAHKLNDIGSCVNILFN